MNKLKERVRQMLLKYPGTRKSDNMLMVMLWDQDIDKAMMEGNGYKVNVQYGYFLKMLMNNKLTNWESATRVRRQLQAKYPELRDKETYEKRIQRSVEFKNEFSNRYNFEGRE